MPVTFVGAGPGAPDLLTVRGVRALEAADAVVYDRPSARELIAMAPPAAERHLVGLAPGHPALPLDEVVALLTALEAGGRAVVRLKAGDPFVASRGGEEALALHAAGVPIDAVPGVSAALAAPAAAGVPVHLRQRAQVLTIVQCNDDPEHAQNEPDWAAIARAGGTLVLLTGRQRLPEVLDGLRAGGMADGAPLVAVSRAGRPDERVARGTVGAPPPPLKAPVTFVLGATADLALSYARAVPTDEGAAGEHTADAADQHAATGHHARVDGRAGERGAARLAATDARAPQPRPAPGAADARP